MPPKVPSANRGSRDMLLCQKTVLFRCAAKVVDLNSLKMFVFERTCQKTARQFPNTRIILDATEIMINKPGKVNDQRCTWSSYKTNNTLKAMIGCSPRGVVTYVSKAYGGAISDRQIIENSELLNGCFSGGKSIMADRGILV